MTSLSELLFRVIVCTAAVAATGCAAQKGTEGATALITNPVAPSETHPALPAQTPTSITVSITDGWTGAAVTGAHVTMDDTQVVTGADGTFHVTPDGKCVVLDILAEGFLHRRTCAKASVTLWPISNDAELVATRTAAFRSSDRLADLSPYREFYGVRLEPYLQKNPTIEAVWSAAAAQIKEATHGKLDIPLGPNLWDEGYLVSLSSEAARCTDGSFTWNISVAGFCWMPTSHYFLTNVVVDPAAIARSDVAVRVLLYSYALREHPLPGLMNATQPAAELSTFERKTLHMMSSRWGTEVKWPDFDTLP